MRKALLLCLSALLLITSNTLAEPDLLTLWVPDNDWALQLDMHGFNIQGQSIAPELNGRSLSAEDANHRLLLRVHIDPASDQKTSELWRDAKWDSISSQPIYVENVQPYSINEFAVIEYNLAGWDDVLLDPQRNMLACKVQGQTLITVHLASVSIEPGDEGVFARLFGSLKVNEGYLPTSWDYFAYGSWCYNNDDFANAARLYQSALDQERVKPALSRPYWLVLVDNLAMAYGIPGDHSKAREILRYGLSLEPEYPMFHYNLACTFGEEKKLDSSLVYLEKAYQFEANMIPGEVMPNPREDKSFKRFWANRKFQRAVRKLRE